MDRHHNNIYKGIINKGAITVSFKVHFQKEEKQVKYTKIGCTP